jgi:catechol 2,3-dioxygenase-like lactoylglutathione lyase family enzyme
MYLKGNLEGIQHLGLPVTDLERSRDFYLNFGFIEVMRTDLHPEQAPVRVAMLQKDNLTIELYQSSGARREEIATRKDGHIDHIALNVQEIESALSELKAAGFEILEKDAPVFLPFWSHGVKYFTVRGPDGEKVEFNQILK